MSLSSDKDKAVKDFINKTTQTMKLYTTGFACQLCSMSGCRKDFEDTTDLGPILLMVSTTLTNRGRRPPYLENGKGFTALGGGKYPKLVVEALEEVIEKAALHISTKNHMAWELADSV